MKRIMALLALSMAVSAAEEIDLQKLRGEVRAMRAAYESRISDLESEVKELRSGTVAEKKNANQALDAVLSNRSPADKAVTEAPYPAPAQSIRSGGNAVRSSEAITLGGYTEFSYTDRSNRIPEFDQVKTVAEMSATLHQRIHLYLELEQEHGGTIEAGNANGSEIEVEQAYLDFSIIKAFNLRFGTMLVPLGRFNLYHEGFVNNFVDRPLVDRWVIPTTWWEEGVGFHGDPIATKTFGLNYELDVFNPARADGAVSKTGFREVRNEGGSPESRGKAAAARVSLEPARGAKWFADNFELGLSGYISQFHRENTILPNGTLVPKASTDLHVTALDFTYEKNHFGLRAEGAISQTGSGANLDQQAQYARGFYTEAFYTFKPCFLKEGPMAKNFADPRLVAALRFDLLELNPGRIDARDLKRITTGLSFRPLTKTVVKLDYQLDFSHSGLPGDTIAPDSGTGKHSNAILFGVATGF